MIDNKAVMQQALDWMLNHGGIVFAGGGMNAVDPMNKVAQDLRKSIAQSVDPDDLTIAYMSGLADGKKIAQTAHVHETDCGNITQTNLVAAAQAVLDRWNSPQWEWVKNGPTGGLMQVLRKALDSIYIPAAIAQPVSKELK